MGLLLGQIVASGGGNPVIGLLFIGFVVWMICLACKPKNKGYHITHRGDTTIKPRK